jgi:hypothetical protein
MTVPSTLQDIRNKTRRLTGSPSITQLTDNQIDEAVNTYYTYDMPQQLKLFNLKEEFEFYTQPNIDTYDFPRNEYRTVNPPLFLAGYESFWSQSEDHFYRIYPQLEFIEEVGQGDGTTGPFNFTLTNIPMLRGYTSPGKPQIIFSQVLVSGVSGNTNQIARDDGNGAWIDQDGNFVAGSIDYVTGVGSVTFNNAIDGTINAQNIPYVAARPQALLFFNDIFFLRPVPDQAYKVQMEAFRTPTSLIGSGTSPLLDEWWQYLAFGASKKILEDRLDMDGLGKIIPLLEEQQRLVLRRTIVQQTNERTATIYTEQTQFPTNNNFNTF